MESGNVITNVFSLLIESSTKIEVKILIEKRADIHAGNENTLRWSVYFGHLEVDNETHVFIK